MHHALRKDPLFLQKHAPPHFISCLRACALHHQSTLRTIVRENVRNNSEKRKKSCFFLDFDKNVKTHVQFQRPLNHSGL